MLSYRNSFLDSQEIGCELVHFKSMVAAPVISIMIPTYRRPQLLQQAIASALNQKTDIPFEVVVVDNDQSICTDKVDEVVRSFSASNLLLYRNHKNIGMFGNWNRCIELARGRFLTILNDDDRLLPAYIDVAANVAFQSKGAAVLVKYKEIDMTSVDRPRRFVFARTIFNAARHRVYKWRSISLGDLLYKYPAAGSLGVMLDKELSLKVGGFNHLDWPIADYVFMCKYWRDNGLVIVFKMLAEYRWGENESANPDTIAGFIEKGIALRQELIGLYLTQPPRWFLKVFISQAEIALSNYKKHYSINLDVGTIRHRIGLESSPPAIPVFFDYLYRVFWMLFDCFIKVKK